MYSVHHKDTFHKKEIDLTLIPKNYDRLSLIRISELGNRENNEVGMFGLYMKGKASKLTSPFLLRFFLTLRRGFFPVFDRSLSK